MFDHNRGGLYTLGAILALFLLGIVYSGRASNINNGCPQTGPVITTLPNTCVGDQNNVTSSSIGCNWSPSGPPAGSSLVCAGLTYNGGTAVTGLSISDGTSFTNSLAARDYSSGGNRWILLSYRFNIGATAPSPVTLTLAGGNDKFANIICNAFTDTGTPTVDGTCTQGSTNTAATMQCSSAMTTTGLDYVTAAIGAGGTFPTVGPGFTIGANVKGSVSEFQIQTAAGSINPLFNLQVGQIAGMNGLAIKP